MLNSDAHIYTKQTSLDLPHALNIFIDGHTRTHRRDIIQTELPPIKHKYFPHHINSFFEKVVCKTNFYFSKITFFSINLVHII